MKQGSRGSLPQIVDSVLIRYYVYHKYVYDVSNQVSILDFHSLVSRPIDFIEFMAMSLSVQLDRNTIESRLPDILLAFKHKERDKKVSGSSLPNEKRDLDKLEFFDFIKTNPMYNKTNSLYERLRARSVL